MRIIYLDQNKWIDLAKAVAAPDDHPAQYAVLETLVAGVRDGRMAVPLSFANIYETHKINNSSRRHNLAHLQATLSRGLVFRGRYVRLEAELVDLLVEMEGLPPTPRPKDWFLSSLFFESVAEAGDPRLPPCSEKALAHLRRDPPRALYDYLVRTPDDVRRAAVRKFSGGSDDLRQRVERRRALGVGESLAVRRRIYSAALMIDEIDLILAIARKAGLSWRTASDIGASRARRIMNDVPIYCIERELALRLEGQRRLISENDFRDMQAFCAVVPYADDVIAENQFVNLAWQAKLGPRYGTRISTHLATLENAEPKKLAS